MILSVDNKDFFPSELKQQKSAVLVSGGVESFALVALAVKYCPFVYPIYVNFEMSWTAAELYYLRELLPLFSTSPVNPLKVLDLPVSDIYGSHWSITGQNIPTASTTDEAVYLPGRNLLLLAKVSVWCALNDITAVMLGTLKSNPFSDTKNDFFEHIAQAIEIGLNSQFKILRPFAQLTKAQAMSLQRDLPWEKTFSCINPVPQNKGFVHCGECNKCAERKKAFVDVGLQDMTTYNKSLSHTWRNE